MAERGVAYCYWQYYRLFIDSSLAATSAAELSEHFSGFHTNFLCSCEPKQRHERACANETCPS